jgi:hypothetical protein
MNEAIESSRQTQTTQPSKAKTTRNVPVWLFSFWLENTRRIFYHCTTWAWLCPWYHWRFNDVTATCLPAEETFPPY